MHTHTTQQRCRIIGNSKTKQNKTKKRTSDKVLQSVHRAYDGDEGRRMRILLGLAPTTLRKTFRAFVLGGVRCLHTWRIIIDLSVLFLLLYSFFSVCYNVLALWSAIVMIFLRVCPSDVILTLISDDMRSTCWSHRKNIQMHDNDRVA